MMSETPTLTAIYDLGEEDILLLEQFAATHNPAVRGAVLRNQIAGSVVPGMALVLISLIATRRVGPLLVGLGLLVSGVLFVVNRFGFDRALKKQVAKNVGTGMYAPILGLNRMTLAANGVTVKAPMGESRVEWSHVSGVTLLAEGTLYVLLTDGKSFIVPRRAFDTDLSRQAFFDLASAYYKAAHEGATTA